ncbi:hypothetical protein OV079_20235 [Nannocystis pusilla]|uniref:Uncharacterized protein n=1 Tax=Nannocystis pusilla TaxID=889268 RepID=A0A9X3IYA4_9BACT|nr:hypothetical protein [Nannocystis pusilla]MCY1007840.1 hypothetical protein [Nannocystis pusilla]
MSSSAVCRGGRSSAESGPARGAEVASGDGFERDASTGEVGGGLRGIPQMKKG